MRWCRKQREVDSLEAVVEYFERGQIVEKLTISKAELAVLKQSWRR